jgi:outer membrane lipoprotein-sorting protein
MTHAANLDAAETYLNNLTTLTANFQQIAPDGSFARGELFIKRPGKMRWNYAPPNEIQMVANDDTLIYYDAEMDEVSYLSLDDTLAAFITKPSIDFDDPELLISRVADEAGLLRFSVSHRAQPDNGALLLVFRTDPMQLYQLLIENAGGEVTIITLDNIRKGAPLDDALFRFKKPK